MTGDKTGYNSPSWLHAIASPSRSWTQTKIASYLTYCNKDIHVGRVSIACIDRPPLNNVI